MSEAQYVEDVDAFLEGLTLPEDGVPICMRGDLQSRFEELERALDVARRKPAGDTLASSDSEARAIAEEIEALRAEMQTHVRVFLLRARPRKEWSDLGKEHPPRKQDPGDVQAGFNRETFPVAALAACSVKPKMSVEKAGTLVDRVTQGQWNALWDKIIELNGGSGEVPFSWAASEILSSTSRS